MAPLPSLREFHHRTRVNDILDTGWGTWSGYDDSKMVDNSDTAAANGIDPSTYGEITQLGARQLFHHMKMTKGSRDDVVFYDLGSGTGKLIAQSYLELPRLTHATGVELSSTRHAAALASWNTVSDRTEDIRGSDARVTFRNGDLFHVDIADATHIYLSSLCFTEDMMDRLGSKLLEAPDLRCVASLKPIPGLVPKEKTKMNYREEYVQMSWNPQWGGGCRVFIYTLMD